MVETKRMTTDELRSRFADTLSWESTEGLAAMTADQAWKSRNDLIAIIVRETTDEDIENDREFLEEEWD